MKQIYAYVRVSSASQNISRQIASMTAQGVLAENIFIDHQSGKDFNRKAYKKLLKRLKNGDLLIIHELDRIGRNYEEILENWRLITKKKMVDIRVLDMPILDTTVHKDLLGTLISDIVLQVLSYGAQKQRESILKSQREGIAEAKKKGVVFGRPPKELPADFAEQVKKWRNDEISITDVSEHCKISVSTVRRRVRELGL
jgi:DNA invertase Pin-like site-specific DNA recombinase